LPAFVNQMLQSVSQNQFCSSNILHAQICPEMP
jgi:hypothetical protein